MSEIKKDEIFQYVPFEIYRFNNVSQDAEVEFEFPYLKPDHNFVHYVDNGCGCTRAWFEDGKVKGVLSVSKAGIPLDNGVPAKGTHPINKTITVMLDPSEHYLVAGPKKEKVINQKKPWFRLTIAGTVVV